MPSKLPQISFRLTESQRESTNKAIAMRDKDQAAYIRWLIAEDCKELGIEWVDDLPLRGKYKRNKEVGTG